MKKLSNAVLGGAAAAFLALAAVLIFAGLAHAHSAHPVFTRPAHVAVYHPSPAPTRRI